MKRKHNDYKVKIRKDSSTLIIHALYTLEPFLSSQILRRKILKIFTFFLVSCPPRTEDGSPIL